jgi:hypothetical protein
MIFVCGDTHMNIDIDKLLPEYWYQGQRLTKDDYLIILGDVGFAWFVEKDEMEVDKVNKAEGKLGTKKAKAKYMSRRQKKKFKAKYKPHPNKI